MTQENELEGLRARSEPVKPHAKAVEAWAWKIDGEIEVRSMEYIRSNLTFWDSPGPGCRPVRVRITEIVKKKKRSTKQ